MPEPIAVVSYNSDLIVFDGRPIPGICEPLAPPRPGSELELKLAWGASITPLQRALATIETSPTWAHAAEDLDCSEAAARAFAKAHGLPEIWKRLDAASAGF